MFAVYNRATVRMVPFKFSVCVGVVEGKTTSSYPGVYVAGIPVFLVRDATGLRRDGRDLGPPLFNLCPFLSYFSFTYLVFLRGKHVYS